MNKLDARCGTLIAKEYPEIDPGLEGKRLWSALSGWIHKRDMFEADWAATMQPIPRAEECE